MMISRLGMATLVLAVMITGPAMAYPITVENCGRELTFAQAPMRAVVQDINMSEMLFALHAQPVIAGIIGVSGWYKTTPAFDAARGTIPELAPKYGSTETLLAANADFYLAGWYYGMVPGGPLTPDTLARIGITAYVLTESCAQVRAPGVNATMDLLYTDELALGRIFDRADIAKTLVADWHARIARVADAVRGQPRLRVFVYDSGEDKPFTAGRFAMPTALIDAAGGRNLLDDVNMSWGSFSWESVALRDPQFLILLDYQNGFGYRKLLETLKANPAMAATEAVRNQRFIALRYEQLTPGPANIDAVEVLAQSLHPSAFAPQDQRPGDGTAR